MSFVFEPPKKIEETEGEEKDYYIVKQKICTTLDEDTLITHLISDDTYYARTQKRDAEYNVIFGERGKEIDGKRIKSSMFTRKYID